MAWTIEYYSPRVAKAVEAWPVGIRARFLRLVEMMAAHGPDLGMPHTRAMGGGLFEVRTKAAEGIGRAFYCTMVGHRVVILHAIVKKSQKTPKADLETARVRLKELKP